MLKSLKSYFILKRAFSIKKWARNCQFMDMPAYYNGKLVKGT